MSARKISQREAHRMRRNIKELEARLREKDGELERIPLSRWKDVDRIIAESRITRRLGFRYECVPDGDGLQAWAVRRKS